MFVLQLLVMLTTCTVLLLEVYSGAIDGPQWWVFPGALVLALVLAFALFTANPKQSGAASFFQFIFILIFATALSYAANYGGRDVLFDIYQERVEKDAADQQSALGAHAAPPGIRVSA